MERKLRKFALLLGVGTLLMTSTVAARADDDGGLWMRLNVGPLHPWIAPPPPVARPPVRYYRPAWGYQPRYWQRRDERRDWRRREWREHHRWDRDWRHGDDYEYDDGRPYSGYRY
ncbi:hypothetical protein BJI67_11250 [Acidihalobacter aeolianus]|uniref:Uncharacterized protein n=1 Tax=Acidihalobacter aeolianus TaxID=2792603 RepID=A0A1D8K9F0_9GAMM|nr:hypothetical protein [Acidihalobacter aeolianus]AOV17561.1 hypothetical protein BJI67_11250 [Acidihalobacter aeolianus]